MSFVKSRNGSYRVDVEQKLGSIVSNEIILREMKSFFETTCRSGDVVVDVGAGGKPFEIIYESKFRSCISFDLGASDHRSKAWTFQASAENIPLRHDVADVVICTEVLEHTQNPRKVITEISRICKKGGYIALTTPFLIGIHDPPRDYYRFTEFGLKELLRDSQFESIRIRTRGEILGVLLSMCVTVQLRFWRGMAQALRIRHFTSLYNPLIFLFVYFPQVLYVLLEEKLTKWKFRIVRAWFERFSHYNLGYVVIAKKRSSG